MERKKLIPQITAGYLQARGRWFLCLDFILYFPRGQFYIFKSSNEFSFFILYNSIDPPIEYSFTFQR